MLMYAVHNPYFGIIHFGHLENLSQKLFEHILISTDLFAICVRNIK